MKQFDHFNPFNFMRLGVVISFSLLLSAGFGLSSCAHDGDASQVAPVSYRESIAPIMAGNCSMTGCHDGGSEFGLKTYSQVMNYVTPGNSRKSSLYQKVTSSYSFLRMPPAPTDPLTKQQRTLIDVWILQGAKDN